METLSLTSQAQMWHHFADWNLHIQLASLKKLKNMRCNTTVDKRLLHKFNISHFLMMNKN